MARAAGDERTRYAWADAGAGHARVKAAAQAATMRARGTEATVALESRRLKHGSSAFSPPALTSMAPVPTITGAMLRQRRDLAVGLLALALLCVLWIPTAGAHPPDLGREPAPPAGAQSTDAAPLSPPEEPPMNPPPAAETTAAIPVAPVVALLGVLLLGLGTLRRPVTAVRVLLALLVVVAAGESAVHSVHHLDNPQGRANCQVLTITQQLHGEAASELSSAVPVAEFCSYKVAAVPPDTAKTVRRPDEGRAPPLPFA